jgi:peroxiredoxin
MRHPPESGYGRSPGRPPGRCLRSSLRDVTSGLDAYSNLDAAVYGISVDSPHAQHAWATQERIGVTLLSDLNKEVTTAYDVAIDGPVGKFSARAAFVIGRNGMIKHSERTPTPKDLPDFNAIKAALATP